MARTRTLTNLIADVRNRTNMENSTFVTDAEITELINQELALLHGRMTMAEGQPHFRSSTVYSLTTSSTSGNLPSDFWRVMRVISLADGVYRDMTPFMEGERAMLLNAQSGTMATLDGPKYRLAGDTIEFLPVTQSFSATLYYVRSSPRLSAGSDTTDGFNGYEMAAVYGACAAIREKEEGNPGYFASLKSDVYKLVDSLAASRDASHPERVTDVTGGLGMVGDWFV
jgi:hypothetical protein